MDLGKLEVGEKVKIKAIKLSKELKLRLKELGIREKEEIEIFSKNINSVIVKIKNIKIVLDKKIIENIEINL